MAVRSVCCLHGSAVLKLVSSFLEGKNIISFKFCVRKMLKHVSVIARLASWLIGGVCISVEKLINKVVILMVIIIIKRIYDNVRSVCPFTTHEKIGWGIYQLLKIN